MPIDSLNSVANGSLALLQGSSGPQSVRPGREEREEGEDRGARSAEREQASQQQFVGAVAQALQSVGVEPPSPPQASAEVAEEPREPAAAQVQEAQQALTYELFRALQSSQNQGLGSAGTNSTDATNSTRQPVQGTGAAAGYTDDIGSRIQTLIRDASASGAGGQTDGLKAAFDRLVQATQPEQQSENADGQGRQPEFQTFLRNLAQNLQGAGPVGGAVNTLV